jgi:hypothetical protein
MDAFVYTMHDRSPLSKSVDVFQLRRKVAPQGTLNGTDGRFDVLGCQNFHDLHRNF